MITQAVKETPLASSNYFCSKYYQEGLEFPPHSLTANDSKKLRPENTLLLCSVQRKQSRDCCRREMETTPLLPSLLCLVPFHSLLQFPPFSFCFPCPHPTPTLPRVYSSYQSWACPLAAGKSCLQAGNCRNSPLVVFSLFVRA